jgi:hypothetical protein
MSPPSPTMFKGFSRIEILLACFLFAAAAFAQDTTHTTTQSGTPTVTTQVRSGEVVYVSGNDLVVKTDDGQVKHFTVPDSARATVDGKELSVHELKPGMRLTRTITTTTVPKTVKSVRTITGTVWNVNAPSSVILTLPDNKNKQYRVPKGQVFDINGQKTDVFGLRKGMKVTATVLTETPATVTTTASNVTGQPAPTPAAAPETPPMVGVLLVEVPGPAKEATTASAPEATQSTLPQTASILPLLGIVGVLCVGGSIALRMTHT